ncbi:MAG: hypothetical protein HGA44_00725, partial [Cellulomonadaceae bacterium]|nr:hypothetical protein [Cellulomonadaceae bacterium]
MPDARAPIFDTGPRSRSSPGLYREPSFDFLNRVAGDFWDHPRRLVQEWADRISDDGDYAELRARMRSHSDHAFNSAFLELYLHETFAAAGWSVTIHPRVAGTSRRPDFLVERDGVRVYVEAILPGRAPAKEAATNRRNVLLDTIDAVGDPNFFLCLDELKDGGTPPSGAPLRRELQHWLKALDPDAYPDFGNTPSYTWRKDGWSATFRAIPKAPHARGSVGDGHRSIGILADGEAAIVDDAPTIRAALAEKHHAYGDLGAPFVIAVGLYTFDSDRWHSTAAFYGSETLAFDATATDLHEPRLVRRENGYFGAPPRWSNKNVSGALLINQLQPYSVPRADVTLWRHPDPTHPLPTELGVPAQEVSLVDGQIRVTCSPLSASDHFGLSADWPPGEPWPR